MAQNGPICRMFSKELTKELLRMTKGERAVFLLDLAERWGEVISRHRKVEYPKKKRKP